MSNEALQSRYQSWFIADAYDALASLVFAPVGGVTRMRRAALDHFAIADGERVLELGCGSGGMTRLLCERGARVTAVDWSAPMLRRAARRAPDAELVRSEITSFEPWTSHYDVVLACFVLHELDESTRARALRVARRALHAHGRLAIVDHAIPERGILPRSLSRLVHGVEPPSSRGRWLYSGGAELESETAGFTPERRIALAAGMAFALQAKAVPA